MAPRITVTKKANKAAPKKSDDRIAKRPARGYHTFKNGMPNVTPKGVEDDLYVSTLYRSMFASTHPNYLTESRATKTRHSYVSLLRSGIISGISFWTASKSERLTVRMVVVDCCQFHTSAPTPSHYFRHAVRSLPRPYCYLWVSTL
jgi:hypothetical protein